MQNTVIRACANESKCRSGTVAVSQPSFPSSTTYPLASNRSRLAKNWQPISAKMNMYRMSNNTKYMMSTTVLTILASRSRICFQSFASLKTRNKRKLRNTDIAPPPLSETPSSSPPVPDRKSGGRAISSTRLIRTISPSKMLKESSAYPLGPSATSLSTISIAKHSVRTKLHTSRFVSRSVSMSWWSMDKITVFATISPVTPVENQAARTMS
mmetsp:Transcript_40716/g.93670  ORF Transcript_40716/g.93670 Transcript_40716/m.93670 type:complete len:212 (-) Transcript_40716:841-1476(-)